MGCKEMWKWTCWFSAKLSKRLNYFVSSGDTGLDMMVHQPWPRLGMGDGTPADWKTSTPKNWTSCLLHWSSNTAHDSRWMWSVNITINKKSTYPSSIISCPPAWQNGRTTMIQEPPPRNHLGLGLWEVGNRRGAETAEGVAGASCDSCELF